MLYATSVPHSPIIIFWIILLPEHETREPKVVTCDLSDVSVASLEKRKILRGVIASKGALFPPRIVHYFVSSPTDDHINLWRCMKADKSVGPNQTADDCNKQLFLFNLYTDTVNYIFIVWSEM